MTSRILAATLAAGCVMAAAGGAYVAVRHNSAGQAGTAITAPEQRAGGSSGAPGAGAAPLPAATEPAAGPARPAGPAVSETEAVVDAAKPAGEPAAQPAPPQGPPAADRRDASPSGATRPSRSARSRASGPAPAAQAAPAAPAAAPAAAASAGPVPPAEHSIAAAAPGAPADPEPWRAERQAPRVPQFEEVVVPASSVLGLRVDTPLSSERARIEDRVDARISRDVTVDGRVAIPSGSRVIGSVTVVERGGKVRERARLGVRFHTLVLADGREVPLRTEAILREGDSPANESARKIGGAAIGGAILGAIMGGGKGAMMGGAAGAAGGSTAVMSGERNAATLPSGSVVSVRLSAPATIEVERPQP